MDISRQAERIVGATKDFSVTTEGETVFFSAHHILRRQMQPLQIREEFNSLLREQKFQ